MSAVYIGFIAVVHINILILLGIVTLSSCGQPPLFPATQPPSHETLRLASASEVEEGLAEEGSYIVTFKTDFGEEGLHFSDFHSEYKSHYLPLSGQFLADPRIEDIQFLTSVNLANPQDTQFKADLFAPKPLRLAWNQNSLAPMVGAIARVDFKSQVDANDLLKEWESERRIWFAEPNYVSHLNQSLNADVFTNLALTYEKLSTEANFWWIERINLAGAFKEIANFSGKEGKPSEEEILNSSPIVAVMDSGVDYDHPALSKNIWENQSQNASSCLNDLHGCNTTKSKKGSLGNGDVWPVGTTGPGQACDPNIEQCSHGTHVSGIIVGNNSENPQVAGVCPFCQVMVIKIVGETKKGIGILDSSIIAGFKYVTLFKRNNASAVRVINASFGKFVHSKAVALLVRVLKDTGSGTLVIGAAGNEDTTTIEYPAGFSDAVAVAAVDREYKKAPYSNFGRWVDIAGPGTAITSTIPGGSTQPKSGTSMAAPVVAGVTALMVAANPTANYAKIKRALLESSDPSLYSKDTADGYNYYYYYPLIKGETIRQPLLGQGLLDAQAAVTLTTSTGRPTLASSDRVNSLCGTIAKRQTDESPPFGGNLILWLIPCLVVFFGGQFRKKNLKE